MPAKTKATGETHWMPRQRSPTQQMMAWSWPMRLSSSQRPKKPCQGLKLPTPSSSTSSL